MSNHSLRAIAALFILFSFSSVYAQTKVVVIPLDSTPAPIKYSIGDLGPGGGIVFHVTNGGLNGLEAAPFDQGTAPWNCQGTDVQDVDNIDGIDEPDSNSGALNTPLIAVACPGEATNAAVRAAGYIWSNDEAGGFLPNKVELKLLYAQRNVVGGFDTDSPGELYWTSSEASELDAWDTSFADGTQLKSRKFTTYRVRAIRAF